MIYHLIGYIGVNGVGVNGAQNAAAIDYYDETKGIVLPYRCKDKRFKTVGVFDT